MKMKPRTAGLLLSGSEFYSLVSRFSVIPVSYLENLKYRSFFHTLSLPEEYIT